MVFTVPSRPTKIEVGKPLTPNPSSTSLLVSSKTGNVNPCLVDELLHRRSAFARIDGQQFKAFGFVLQVKIVQRGHLGFARRTPRRPAVDQHRAALVIGDGMRDALQIGEREIGDRFADLRRADLTLRR